MTLFIRMPRRESEISYEISDLYFTSLSFCIFFAVGRIVKSVVKKQERQREKSKYIQIPNPKGGAIEFQISDDRELSGLIISCIADNEAYLVKDEKIIKVIFSLVKAKIKDESLVLTPNMIRFLALRILNSDSGLIAKIGNVIVSSDNRVRLLTRVMGAAGIGLVSALLSSFAYGILIMILYFDTTHNCGYRCNDYFEHLPKAKDQSVRVFAEKSTGQLVISGNDDAHQVEIYIPSETSNKVNIISTGEAEVTKTYKKTRKKAKVVKFSDFRAKDEVLSSFDGLEEPIVPQNVCPINDAHDLFKVRID